MGDANMGLGTSQRGQTQYACMFLDCFLLWDDTHSLLTFSKGTVHLVTQMPEQAWEKPGTSQRAQTWSACIFSDCVLPFCVHLLPAPSEGDHDFVTQMKKCPKKEAGKVAFRYKFGLFPYSQIVLLFGPFIIFMLQQNVSLSRTNAGVTFIPFQVSSPQ